MSFYQYLKSLKLAIALLVYLTIAGSLSTLIPQGLDPVYYSSHYPKFVATLIIETHFNRFFTSLLFLGPAILFFINLTLCTVDRFRKELKKKRGPRRFSPDILHFGLILLTIGSIVSFSGRQEGYVELAIGDKVELPDKKLLKLVDFQYLMYPDGRPQDWISTVQITEGPKTIIEKADIRVNHPLKVGHLKLYQVSHKVTTEILLEDPSAKTIHLMQGDRITRGNTSLFFMAVEGKGASSSPRVVLHTSGPAGTRVIRAEKGDKVLDLSVKDIRPMNITGLEAVTDPGTTLVFVAFLIVLIGLSMTFIQKLKTLSKQDKSVSKKR